MVIFDANVLLYAVDRADIVSFDRDFGRFPGIRHRLPGA
jgi:predicted nucleic acid-binding protein